MDRIGSDKIRKALLESHRVKSKYMRRSLHAVALLLWSGTLIFFALPEFIHGRYVDKSKIESVVIEGKDGVRLDELVELTCNDIDEELSAAHYWIFGEDEGERSNEEKFSRLKDAIIDANDQKKVGLSRFMQVSGVADRNIRGWWSDAYSILSSPDAICGPHGRWKVRTRWRGISMQSLLHSDGVQSKLLNEIAAARTISWIARTNSALTSKGNVERLFDQIQGKCTHPDTVTGSTNDPMKCKGISAATYHAFVCGMSQFRITDHPLRYFMGRGSYEASKNLKEGDKGYLVGYDICKNKDNKDNKDLDENKKRSGSLAYYLHGMGEDFRRNESGVDLKEAVAKHLDHIFSSMDGNGGALLVTINVKGEKDGRGRFIIAAREDDCVKSMCGIRIVNWACDLEDAYKDTIEKKCAPMSEKNEWCRPFTASWGSSGIIGNTPGDCAPLKKETAQKAEDQ